MLKSHFDMKDLGKANFILGMKITKTCDRIFLDHLFPVNNDDEIFNQKDYASIIGSLRYATDCTRPDIVYAVGVLSRFTCKSSKDHWLAIE